MQQILDLSKKNYAGHFLLVTCLNFICLWIILTLVTRDLFLLKTFFSLKEVSDYGSFPCPTLWVLWWRWHLLSRYPAHWWSPSPGITLGSSNAGRLSALKVAGPRLQGSVLVLPGSSCRVPGVHWFFFLGTILLKPRGSSILAREGKHSFIAWMCFSRGFPLFFNSLLWNAYKFIGNCRNSTERFCGPLRQFPPMRTCYGGFPFATSRECCSGLGSSPGSLWCPPRAQSWLHLYEHFSLQKTWSGGRILVLVLPLFSWSKSTSSPPPNFFIKWARGSHSLWSFCYWAAK